MLSTSGYLKLFVFTFALSIWVDWWYRALTLEWTRNIYTWTIITRTISRAAVTLIDIWNKRITFQWKHLKRSIISQACESMNNSGEFREKLSLYLQRVISDQHNSGKYNFFYVNTYDLISFAEKFRPERDSNSDLTDAGAELHQLSYQANWLNCRWKQFF